MKPVHAQQITPGATVYARWHGEDTFTVLREVEGQKTPHFVCRLSSLHAVEENWIFPLLHLSTTSVASLTKEANRKQLSLITDGNISDSQGGPAQGEG